jgi:hypothetical protein
LRKRGRISAAALTVIPPDKLDVRRGRPMPPARLSAEERERWEKIVLARRPGWFTGAEAIGILRDQSLAGSAHRGHAAEDKAHR